MSLPKLKHIKHLKPLLFSFFVLSLGLISLFQLSHQDKNTHALDSDFSNGITVDSTLDTPDDSITNGPGADGICDDGDGNCTLRAAIEEANSDPDASTILFNIQTTPDFTNNSQDGYTISPQSALPDLTEQTTIDGYSQPGAQANTAIAPNPFNGTLLIEVEGSGAGNHEAFMIRGDSTELHGLVINDFNGSATIMMADGVIVRGSYLGTDPTGLVAKPNVVGVNTYTGPDRGANALIGGLNPEDRNIISGNTAGGGNASGGYPATGWVVKGNYIGVGADGLTAVPNSSNGGSGGLSIDDTDGVVVGGPEASAINVISGNLSHGIAPDKTTNLLIQNNYIGVGYDGLTSVPNGSGGSGGAGMTVGRSDNMSVIGNIISNNAGDGIFLNEVVNSFIQGNTFSNSGNSGISVGPESHNIMIGGQSSNEKNQIFNNTLSGIRSASDPQLNNDFTAIGNSIYSNDELGIELSYGGTPNDPLDPDTGANDLLNFPEYTSISEGSGNTTVDYNLDVPAGDYRIEFFSNTAPDPSGNGEGETYLGFQNVTSVGAGTQTFSHTLTGTTGVTYLAMTTTQIDNSADGFGATSEFGGEVPPNTDISITKTLTNPQDIAIGAIANYHITYTNNGPNDADLSGFGSVLDGPGLFYDFVPIDLINPSGYLSDGPFPSTYFISVGNPDLTCLYGPAPSASAFGLTPDSTLGMVACWLTGSDTTLESGFSISAELSFETAPDSDLVFTNYVLASPLLGDPDIGVLIFATDSGDIIAYLTDNPVNNFAASAFPVPVEPTESSGGSSSTGGANSGSLASTGQNTIVMTTLALLGLTVGAVLLRKYHLTNKKH